ncbi:hypothetical protein MTO96_026461 [Rhipicephalus appendiculatus]
MLFHGTIGIIILRAGGSFFRKLKAKGESELGALRKHFTLMKEQQHRQGESVKEKVSQATATLGEFLKDRLLHVPSHVKTAVHRNKSGIEGMTTGGLGKASEEFIEETSGQIPVTSGVSKTTEISGASLRKGIGTREDKLGVGFDASYTGSGAGQLANQWPEAKFGVPSLVRKESPTETPWMGGKTKDNSRFAAFQSASKQSNQNVGENDGTVKVPSNEITTPALNVPPSTPTVSTQGGNIEMKLQPPSAKAGPAEGIPVEGGLKGTTVPATAPPLPTIQPMTSAAISAPELPKVPPAVPSNEITTPALNVPPSTPTVSTQGGKIEMNVQPPAAKAGPAKGIPFEGGLKGTTEPATAPPLPTIQPMTSAGKSAPELPKVPPAVPSNEITTPALNVPPSTPTVSTQGGKIEMNVQPPAAKAGSAKGIPVEGGPNGTTEPATAPPLPTIQPMTSAGKSAPELPKVPPAVPSNDITTPALNVPPSTPTVSTQGGKIEMNVQPPAAKAGPAKGIPFEGGLKGTTEPATAPPLPTIQPMTSAAISAPELPKVPPAVPSNEITTPALNVPPSTPTVSTQGGKIEMNVQPPAAKAGPAKGIPFEGGPNGTTEPATAPPLPTIEPMTSAAKSAPELPKVPPAVPSKEITTPALNVPPSTPTVSTQGGKIEMNVQPPAAKAGPAKGIPFEGGPNGTTEPATAPPLPTIEPMTSAAKSAPELPKVPPAVPSNEITTPALNVPPSTPTVSTQGGKIEMNVQPPAAKAGSAKGIPVEGGLKGTTEPATAPHLPTIEPMTSAAKSAPELPKVPPAVPSNEITTPALNVPPSTPTVSTQGGKIEMNVQPPAAKGWVREGYTC